MASRRALDATSGLRSGESSRKAKRVAIVILNHNGIADTLECLESLRGLTYPNYEMIVVDNGSHGSDVKILAERASTNVTVIANDKNYGFAEGNNIGMRRALADGIDYVLLLNNDVVVEPNCLSRLVEAAEADERIGIVAPAIYDYSPPRHQRFPRRVDRWSPLLHFHLGSSLAIVLGGRMPLRSTGLVNHVDGSGMLIKRQVLEAIGLFDPIYFLGGYEDFDLGTRTLQQGYRIVAVVEAKVWHKSRRSWRSPREASLAYCYLNPKNRVIYARKNLSPLQYLLFLSLLPLQSASWILAEGGKGGNLAVAMTILRGIREGYRVSLDSPEACN